MSYDPYTAQNAHNPNPYDQHQSPPQPQRQLSTATHYSQHQSPPQPQRQLSTATHYTQPSQASQVPPYRYNDSTVDFNPYTDNPQPHARNNSTYKSGFDEDGLNESFEPSGVRSAVQPVGIGEKDEFDPFAPPPKSTGDLRIWRQEHHGNLWMKGGRGRCIGRFCCCTIMTTILLIVSIVLAIAMFLRPPDIEFSGAKPIEDGSAVSATSSDLTFNVGIGISVRNPNFFTVAFKSIKASVVYPIRDTEIGGGEQNNVVFEANSKTSLTFPFAIKYSQTTDPDSAILKDILDRCGFLKGSVKRDLSVSYTLTLSIQILFVTFAPPFSGTANFECPLTLDEIKPLISSVPGLQGVIQGAGGLI